MQPSSYTPHDVQFTLSRQNQFRVHSLQVVEPSGQLLSLQEMGSGSCSLTGCMMLTFLLRAIMNGSMQAWQRSQWLTSWWKPESTLRNTALARFHSTYTQNTVNTHVVFSHKQKCAVSYTGLSMQQQFWALDWTLEHGSSWPNECAN